MPKVPISEQQVELQPARAPGIDLPNAPAAAFGGGVAQAAEKLGNAVTNLGTTVGEHVIQMEHEKRDKETVDAFNDFVRTEQDELLSAETDDDGKPKGLLLRQGDQAAGSTLEYDRNFKIKKESAASRFTWQSQNDKLQEMMDARHNSTRETIIRNEAAQNRESFKTTFEDSSKLAVADAANSRTPDDLNSRIDQALEIQTHGLRVIGAGEATVQLQSQKLVGDMTKSAIVPVLETDPKAAQAILDGVKGKIGAETAAEIQKAIDTKAFENTKIELWNQAKGLRLSDGSFDTAGAQKLVDGSDLPADKKIEAFSFIRTMGAVQDTQVKDQRAAADRNFTNDLIKQHQQGLPFPEALKLAGQNAFDDTDRIKKEQEVVSLYTAKADPFDTWLEKQDQGTKLAWEDVKNRAETKYSASSTTTLPGGEVVKQRDAFMTEMKRAALGKSPDEIRQIMTEKMKNVVITPHWFWNSTGSAWKLDAARRNANADKLSLLKKTYGENLVNRAQSTLTLRGILPTPENIKAAIDAIPKDQPQ